MTLISRLWATFFVFILRCYYGVAVRVHCILSCNVLLTFRIALWMVTASRVWATWEWVLHRLSFSMVRQRCWRVGECSLVGLVACHILIIIAWRSEHTAGAECFVDEALCCQDLILLTQGEATDLRARSLRHILISDWALDAIYATALDRVSRHDIGPRNLLKFASIHIHLYLIELLRSLVGWHASSWASQ